MYQHRQIHVWLSESDYRQLREQAEDGQESVSAIVRRLVKSERKRLKVLGCSGALVPVHRSTEAPEHWSTGAPEHYTNDQSE